MREALYTEKIVLQTCYATFKLHITLQYFNLLPTVMQKTYTLTELDTDSVVCIIPTSHDFSHKHAGKMNIFIIKF